MRIAPIARFLLATFLTAIAFSPVSAENASPYGRTLTFAAYRNGQEIGKHALVFRDNAGRKTISTSIDFAVTALGLTVYRYRHRSEETWIDGAFRSLKAESDDNGKQYLVDARRENDGIAVRRQSIDTLLGLSMSDLGLRRPDVSREILPAGTLPSTHWSYHQVKQSALLNTQSGLLSKIAVTPSGRDMVKTPDGTVEAARYVYDGDVRMEQWFDGRGCWVKSLFLASDGSTIEYILRQ